MDPTSGVSGFFQKYGIWILGGGLVFLASYLILGRKNNPAASALPATGAVGPDGQPISPVEYVPTTGDSFTNINYQSGNSMVDTHNSSSTVDNQLPPPSPAPPPHPTPPPVVVPPPDPNPIPYGHTPYRPGPGGCAPGWQLASDGLCHLQTGPAKTPNPPPVTAPPPVVRPPVIPTPPPTPTETDAQKAVDDWQKANNKRWTGPAGSFPYGWGPAPHAPGAGVVNNGVFSYVVHP